MSGQAAIRGYLVQTLVALFEVISDTEWTSIRLEPGGEEEKADLIIELANKCKRAIQVKSTARTFQEKEIRQYANALETTIKADEYKLILLGSLASGVSLSKILRIGKVIVPEPIPQQPRILIGNAAHELEKWLTSKGYCAIPALARELLVRSLTNSLEEISTGADSEDRVKFEAKLEKWVLTAYPSALTSVAREVDIQLRSNIGTSQQTLKQEACLRALKLVDQLYECKFLPKNKVEFSGDGFDFASEARSCYAHLIVACEDMDVPNLFWRFMMAHQWTGDEIIDLWDAVRQELGFSGAVKHQDRVNAWIAHVDLEPSKDNHFRTQLEELAKKLYS